MGEMLDWVAHLVGGKVVRRRDTGLMKDVAPGSVERFVVSTDIGHVDARTVEVLVDPKRGGFAGTFTRWFRGVNGAQEHSAVVIEVIPDPADPERFVRLYILSNGRLVLSTQDLYF